MIQAILALVPMKRLKVQQMDVESAYLNGILTEQVYMHQPEEYGDGTQRVGHLIKTIYGLRQAGHKWNKVLNAKLQFLRFTPLQSDPCAYIRRHGNNLEIITAWVDDLLLFTTSDELMTHLKIEMHHKFELTDMGELSKIVGVEITKREDFIKISQQSISK